MIPLVGEWKLEDDALDTSGQGNNATILGGATFVDGHVRRALSFDGVDDGLDLGSNAPLQFDLNEAFSTSLWANTTPNGQNHALIGNSWAGPGWHVRITSTNMVRFILVENGTTYRYVDSTVGLGSGYHHIATTWDGASDQRIYIDSTDVTGTPQTRGTMTTITTSANVTVGTLAGVSAPFQGDLDQIRVYASTLSSGEIATLFAETGNAVPVANANAASTSKNTPVTITLTGSDGDGDPLTFAIGTGPSNGTLGTITQLSPTSASVDYTPGTDFVGNDSFTFTVNDGTATSSAATVGVTVSNQIPTAGLIGEWKLEDNVLDTSGNSHDGFAAGPTFLDAKIARGLHFDGVDDTVGLGSGADLQFGLASTFSTSEWINANLDSANHAILGTSWAGPGWHVRITSANRVRFILVQNGGTFRFVDSTTTLTAGWHHIATSWDGNTNQRIYIDGVDVTGTTGTSGTLTSIDNPANISVGTIPGTNIPFSGDIDQIRIYNRVLSGSEVSSLFDEGAGNTPPVASNNSASTPMDAPVTITLSGSDADSDALTFAIAAGPTNGALGTITQLSPTTASVQYTPNASYVGADSFTFTVNDGTATSAAATVSLSVTSTASTLIAEYKLEGDATDTSGNNHHGVANNGVTFGSAYLGNGAYFDGVDDSISLGSDAPLNFDVGDAFSVSTWLNTTPDGANHAIIGNSWAGPGWHVRITSANTIRFILVQNDQTFRYVDSTATLGSGWHHLATTYDGASQMHIFIDGVDVSTSVGSRGTLTNFTNPSGLTVGTIAGANIPYSGGIDQLRIYNTALTGGEVSALFGETIVNATPVANATSASTPMDQGVLINLSGSDGDGDPLTFQLGTPPTNGSLSPILPTGPNTATVIYTPSTSYVGADSFTFTVSDGVATSAAATVSITVTAVMPTAGLVAQYLFEDDVSDSSGNGNNGTVNGGASFIDGLFTRSLRFDGVDDSVGLGSGASLQFALADAFSVSTWLNTTPNGTNRAIIGNAWAGPGWHVRVTSGNKIRFILVQDGLTFRLVDSTVNVTSGFHHIATTYDGASSMKIYIDGVDVSGSIISQGSLTNIDGTSDVTIGAVAGANIPLAGDMDNLRIYGRELTAGEVDTLFSE